MERLKKHHVSFKNAIAGLAWAFRTQPNFAIHFAISLFVLIAAWWLSVSYVEMAILVFAIILGLCAEMINTSIEAMTDLITKEWKQEAKIAKDVAAGMMLLTAIGSITIALFIFLPKIFALIF